jgi:hypothetical protein
LVTDAQVRRLTARGETPAAFGRRCIPADCVAPPSNILDILSRRALSAGRLAALDATLDFHHGLLREKRMDGNTVGAAAATAGMCERTARHWQEGPFPSATKTARTWRTRDDPFESVWTTEVVPRLAADTERRLQALTLFDWLCDRFPGHD